MSTFGFGFSSGYGPQLPKDYEWVQLYKAEDVWAFVLTPEKPKVIRAIVCECTGFWMWRVCCPLTMGIAATRQQAMRDAVQFMRENPTPWAD